MKKSVKKRKETRCVISIYFIHIKKKPVISNTGRFFCFNSTVSYTYTYKARGNLTKCCQQAVPNK